MPRGNRSTAGRAPRPTTGSAEIRIDGLAELNRALRAIDPTLQKELRTLFRQMGVRVRDAVRAAMPVRSGRARSSVLVSNTSNTTAVKHGKASVPYTPWLDFGGVLRPVGGRRNTQRRPQVSGGRYLYPTVDRMRPQLQREAAAAIEHVKAELGLSD